MNHGAFNQQTYRSQEANDLSSHDGKYLEDSTNMKSTIFHNSRDLDTSNGRSCDNSKDT
jgi:hypothetical protein